MPGIQDIAETYVTADTLQEQLDGWMAEVRPYQWRETVPLTSDKAALLVVDMTKAFVDQDRPLASPNARAVVGVVADLVDAFRDAGRPVIWLVQGHHSVPHDRGEHLAAWWPLPIMEGTDDVEMATGLDPKDEKVIIKRRYSGFYQTDLELTLRCQDVCQVVVCGVLTHVCPYTTAVDAFFRDFAVYYPADGTASINRALHVAALQSMAGWAGTVVRSQDIIDWLA